MCGLRDEEQRHESGEDDDRQRNIEDDQGDGDEEHLQHGQGRLEERIRQELLHRLHVRGLPRHEPTRGRLLVIAQVKALHVREDALAQGEEDPLRGDPDQPGRGESENRRGDRRDHEERDRPNQRTHVAVDRRRNTVVEGIGDEDRPDDHEDGREYDDDGEEDGHRQMWPDQRQQQGACLLRNVRRQLLDFIVAVEAGHAHERPPSCD